MPKPRRVRIATLMIVVVVVALSVALVQREREVRRLRAELEQTRIGAQTREWLIQDLLAAPETIEMASGDPAPAPDLPPAPPVAAGARGPE